MRSQIAINSKFIKRDKYHNMIKVQVCLTHHDNTLFFLIYLVVHMPGLVLSCHKPGQLARDGWGGELVGRGATRVSLEANP